MLLLEWIHTPARKERSKDWYISVLIVGFSGALAAILLGNVSFGVVVLLGTLVVVAIALSGERSTKIQITKQGLQINEEFYPRSHIDGFSIEDEAHSGAYKLHVQIKRTLFPVRTVVIENTHPDRVKTVMLTLTKEADVREPVLHKILEHWGF